MGDRYQSIAAKLAMNYKCEYLILKNIHAPIFIFSLCVSENFRVLLKWNAFH